MTTTTTTLAAAFTPATTTTTTRTSKLKPTRRGDTVRAMAGAPFEVPAKYTKATPMGGRVLIKIAETERETKGGVLLTEGSQQKPTSGA